MTLTLRYEKRDRKQSPNALRKSGTLPAVFYGRKQAATPIVLSAREFEKVWKKAGENIVVTLVGPDTEVETLIHEVDRHPVTGNFRHADFYAFEKGQKLRVKVPIEFTGTAPAVKDLGGVLVKVLRDLEIEAEPKNLPPSVSVDVASLMTFESVVTATQAALPAGVTLVTAQDEVVASVYEPKEEVVEAAPAPDLSEIPVVQKGKEAVAGEGAAGAPKSGADAASGQAALKKEEKKEGKKGERKQ